jgi:HAD superfamily hydrolase (TIGR01509 family)
MIHAIIFDCFGVLVHGSLNHLRSLTPPEHMDELNDLSHNSDYGYVTQADYLQGVGDLLGRSAAEIADIINAQYVRNEQVVELARSLRGEYKVAMLSNVGRGVINGLFSAEELDELFDVVILSSEVGMVKPHRDIYELAARSLDLTPEECLMIDDLPANIAGAEAAGMTGVICADAAGCVTSVRALLKEQYARVA